MSALSLDEIDCDEIRVEATPLLKFRPNWTPKESDPSLF